MQFLLLALFLSLPALASNNAGQVQTQKSLDGKTIYCSNEGEVGQVGYQPNLPLVLGGEELVLSFGIIGVECAPYNKSTGYQWAVHRLTDSFTGRDLNGEAITTFVREAEALVITANHQIVSATPLENVFMQLVQVPLPLEKIMSKAQRRSLASGKEVTVKLEYFNRYKVEIERGGRSVYRGQRAGGSYYYTFTINQDSSGLLKSSAVSIQ